MALNSAERTNIIKLTVGLFNAAPGAAGLSDFTIFYEANGRSLNALALNLGNNVIFRSLYPNFQTISEFATALLSPYGLQDNTDAIAFVTTRFSSPLTSAYNKGSIAFETILAINNSTATSGDLANARAILNNKTLVAENYSVTLKGQAVAIGQLQAVVKGVTADPATVTFANLINSGVNSGANSSVTPAVPVTVDSVNSGTNASVNSGSNFVLTVNQDIVTGGAGPDNFRGIAGGNSVGGQDTTTFNNSDILDGGAGQDTLVIDMTGNTYSGGARVKNIETLQIGTNLLTPVTFDYNASASTNEITDITKIVYDQINAGESLTINNIVRSLNANTNSTVLPILAFVNDTITQDAGTATANYRAAEVTAVGNTLTTGTPAATPGDTQTVQLQSVEKGVLNIGPGIETIAIQSLGTERVTLNNASAAYQDTGVNSNPADLVSAGTVTRVALSGTAEIGKLAGVVGSSGLTDRSSASSDFGISVAGAAGNGTGSNLLSVESRVTEIDASAATAAVNVRFVNKSDNSATDVVFKGGAGNDYAEFELGNVNANGGAGNDTFAFITAAAGAANATFGAGDTLVGGTGLDTIQLGLNGAGTYNIAPSELVNKSGFETLDLRGATHNITLTGAFVASTDTGTVMTVRTDKIVQTSLANPANPSGASFAEDNAASTIDLSNINAGQALNFVGGSGSDRLIVTDATATAALSLDGGTNVGNNGGTATAGDYDTITVVNGAVLDRADLANVRNFEGLVLVKNTTGSNNYRVEFTTAFLLDNTQASNTADTSIDDSVFRIGTSSANGTALAAGDTVTIDISDLLNAGRTGPNAVLTGRGVDVSMGAATVNYLVDGTAATTAQVAYITKADSNRADAIGTLVVAPVVAFAGTASGNNGASNATSLSDTFTVVNAQTTLDTLAGDDTVNVDFVAAHSITTGLGDDTITFNVAGTNATVDGGAGTDIVNLKADTGAIILTAVETVNITATQTALVMTSATAQVINNTSVAAVTATLGAGGGTYNGSGAGNAVITGGAAATTFNLSSATANATVTGGAAADVFNITAAGPASVNGGGGNDTITHTGTGPATIAGGAGSDAIVITGATGIDRIVLTAADSNANGFDTITGFNVTNDVFATGSFTGFTTRSINSTTTLTLQMELNAGIASGGGTVLDFNAAGEAILFTVTSFNGGASATFLAISGNTDGFFTTADIVVRLVGVTGGVVLVNTNFVA